MHLLGVSCGNCYHTAMTSTAIVKKTEAYVRKKMQGEGTGHDWWHVVRVRNIAKMIAREEHADVFVVELSALLHDIADHKFHDGDDTIGPRLASQYLASLRVAPAVIEHVAYIISNVSFNKSFDVTHEPPSKELQVMRDADRLDALGAIGIARAFAYGGYRQRELYNPAEKPRVYKSSEDYRKRSMGGHTINHFYEKLLLLKDRMNTKAGKRIAQRRHAFLLKYLEQFYSEWEGKR